MNLSNSWPSFLTIVELLVISTEIELKVKTIRTNLYMLIYCVCISIQS